MNSFRRDRTTASVASAPITPREQIQQILVHLSGRIGLLGQPEEVCTQLVVATGALIQACDAPQTVSDTTLEHLLFRAADTDDVREVVAPLLAACVTADKRVVDEFVDLLTMALLLERSSLGDHAQSVRYDTRPGDINATAQLRPMLERADQVARSQGLLEPSVSDTPAPARPLGREDPAAVSFWEALDPAEREALKSVASWRTFAAGSRLVQEGEQAGHVMVILAGHVKVCVNEDRRERVLAIRGLGELVGERAALQVSARSATVIALEMVQALVVLTKDFAAFISDHPRVLSIVQQEYDRLSREPARDGPALDEAPASGEALTTNRLSRDPNRADPGRYPQLLSGENCTVLFTDVVGFSASTRGDKDRLLIREALYRITHMALQDTPAWWSEDRGDGLLTVIPPSVPTAKVMDHLLRELPAEITRHNGTHHDSAQLRLRVAINVGPVTTDDIGVTGEAIIVAARLVEAPRFKEAVAKSRASLGVIVSSFVYDAVIRSDTDPAERAGYSQINVNTKNSRIQAWIRLLTHNVGRADPWAELSGPAP